MAFDGTDWNEGDPSDTTVANTIDDHLQNVKKGVRARMAHEHVWPASQDATASGGHHSFITFQKQAAAPVLAATTAGALYVGSAAGFPLIFQNSGGTEVTLVGSGASRVSAVAGGTLGSIVICSSASPTTLAVLAASAVGLPLVTMSGTAAPVWTALSSVAIASAAVTGGHITSLIGTWSSPGTTGQAATDMIVMAYAGPGAHYFSGYTDENNPPTTVRGILQDQGAEAGDSSSSLTMPVKKGHYWRIVVTAGSVTCAILSIGA